MSLGVLTFSDPGGVLAITDAATVSRSFDLTTFGLWARVKSLSITLTGLSHTFPDDLDFLFVGPDGTNLAFWSDAGGGTAISNQNYTIRDSASLVLPDSGSIASGTYRPADYSFVGSEQQLGRRIAEPRHQPSGNQRRRHPRWELRRQMDRQYDLDPFRPGRCLAGFRHP